MVLTQAFVKICRMPGHIKIIQGSAGAGKTYAILQRWILMAVKSGEAQDCKIYTETVAQLRDGAVKDFQNICKAMGIHIRMFKNPYRCQVNKWSFSFHSIDHPLKGVGGRCDRLFINEAIRLGYNLAEPLITRARAEVILDFNPFHKFWAHARYAKMDGSSFIKLTFRDNDMQPPLERKKLLDLAPGSPRHDPYRWTVLGLGEIGRLEGRILDYKVYKELPDVKLYKAVGVDFGWVDPNAAAMVCVDREGKRVYWREVFHKGKSPLREMADAIKNSPFYNRENVICDHAPAHIYDLKKMGLPAMRASKVGTLASDIISLNQYSLFIHEGSHNLMAEADDWVYRKELINGEEIYIGKPDDKCADHLLDAARYATKYASLIAKR